MSLEDLLGEDTMTIARPNSVTKDTSGGMTLLPYVTQFFNVPVRVETLTTSQQEFFAQREVVCTHTLYTQQTGIQNGWVAVLSDGTTLRLTLGFNANRGIGSIDDYAEILGQQIDQVGVGPPPVTGSRLLLSSGGRLLLEDGDFLLLE